MRSSRYYLTMCLAGIAAGILTRVSLGAVVGSVLLGASCLMAGGYMVWADEARTMERRGTTGGNEGQDLRTAARLLPRREPDGFYPYWVYNLGIALCTTLAAAIFVSGIMAIVMVSV